MTTMVGERILRSVEQHRLLLTRILAFTIVPAALILCPWPAESSAHEIPELLGFGLIAVGACGRLWATLYIAGKKSHQLVTTGPYSVCRHPLYVSGFLLGSGVIAPLQNLFLFVPFALFYFGCYGLVVAREERKLSQRFDPEYENYRRSVPRFLPAFWRYHRGGDQEGWLLVKERLVLRVLLESVLLLLIIPLVEAVEYLHAIGLLPIHLRL